MANKIAQEKRNSTHGSGAIISQFPLQQHQIGDRDCSAAIVVPFKTQMILIAI